MALSILVIDDSPIARTMLIRYLPTTDCDIHEAVNGMDGIELFKQENPDLVFLDLTMPGLSGYEVLDELMALNPKAKVVVVSADVQEKAKQRVLNGGALDMLNKPPDPEKLRALCKLAAA